MPNNTDNQSTTTVPIEMSRPVSLDKIHGVEAYERDFKAKPNELDALTARLNLIGLDEFTGHIEIQYSKAEQGYVVKGTIHAKVTQECGATFQPVPSIIDQSYEELLVTKKEHLPAADDLDDDRVIDLIEGDSINYGEIATQWLALSLPEYPRVEGENISHIEHGGLKENPFAVLEGLKNLDKKDD